MFACSIIVSHLWVDIRLLCLRFALRLNGKSFRLPSIRVAWRICSNRTLLMCCYVADNYGRMTRYCMRDLCVFTVCIAWDVCFLLSLRWFVWTFVKSSALANIWVFIQIYVFCCRKQIQKSCRALAVNFSTSLVSSRWFTELNIVNCFEFYMISFALFSSD